MVGLLRSSLLLSDPVLGIFLIVVFFELLKLEVAGPHDLAKV